MLNSLTIHVKIFENFDIQIRIVQVYSIPLSSIPPSAFLSIPFNSIPPSVPVYSSRFHHVQENSGFTFIPSQLQLFIQPLESINSTNSIHFAGPFLQLLVTRIDSD